MMSEALDLERDTLTTALRAIRQRRGLRARDVAQAMGLAPRTYQHFEAGRSQLNWARIREFAKATDSDAYAILAAVMIGSPDFAVRCMDNKLATVLLVGVRRFDARMGDAIALFEVSRLIAAFRKAFDDLEADLAARDAQSRAWMEGDDPPE